MLESMLPRHRLILADESATELATWQRYLSELDCEIKVTTNGNATLDCLTQFQPDLLLLSATLPGVSGVDVCRKLRGNAATRNIVVVMVTHLNDLSDIERAVDAGTDDFISKPVSKSEMVKRVENMLNLTRPSDDLDHG